MGTLYGYTILADLASLAVVVAIFVFVASIYKGALEFSTKQEEDTLNRRKELIETKKMELAKGMPDIESSTFPKKLRAEIDKLDAELNNIDQSISKSRDRAKVLTVRNLVTIPASFLITSIIASGIAIATSGILATTIWIVSLALLATSLYFIYRNLSVIEFFSGAIDLSTLMEQALDRHRMKSIPIPEMELPDFQLEIRRGETQELIYFVSLKQGLIAKNTRVRFSGTEELDFPGEKIKQFEHDYQDMRKPKEFWHKLGDVNPKEYKKREFKVKAPDQPGEYTMAYWLQCDEYTKDQITFKVKVI